MSKALIKRALAGLTRRGVARRLSRLHVGEGSEVHFWKVAGQAGGALHVGDQSRLETRVTFERPGAELVVGSRSFVGLGYVSCAVNVVIGDDVMVAWNTAIFDHASHAVRFSHRARDVQMWLEGHKDWTHVDMSPVRIKDKSWVGYGCVVLPGVTIGEGAIVGAGSVVTKDVPPWTVVAGNPAKVIRELSDDEH